MSYVLSHASPTISNTPPSTMFVPNELYINKYSKYISHAPLKVMDYRDYLIIRQWRMNFKAGRLYWDDIGRHT